RPRVRAASVALALLATSPNRALNPRRLARFLAITTRGDVEPVVLLTKSDLSENPMWAPDDRRTTLGAPPVLPGGVLEGSGMAAVNALMAPGITAVLLGTAG